MKICFIVSAVGGPKTLFGLLTPPLQRDVAYVVVQRMPDDILLGALVDCLREEVNPEIAFVQSATELRPGQVHILATSLDFKCEGKRLRAETAKTGKTSLDCLVASALREGHSCCALVLPGVFGSSDGMDGLRQLSVQGGHILGPQRTQPPSLDLLEQLQALGLEVHLHPQRNLMEQLWFPAPGNGQHPRILIADDEKDMRDAVAAVLSSAGIASDFAIDGLDALRKLKKRKYDSLVLDLCMPEMDGLQTLEALRTLHPGLPVLVITGHNGKADVVRGLDGANIVGTLMKPFSSDALRNYLPKLAPRPDETSTA